MCSSVTALKWLNIFIMSYSCITPWRLNKGYSTADEQQYVIKF